MSSFSACVLCQFFEVDAECISTLISFDRLHALCHNARSSVNVPVVQAAESLIMHNASCCDSAPLRKFVFQ